MHSIQDSLNLHDNLNLNEYRKLLLKKLKDNLEELAETQPQPQIERNHMQTTLTQAVTLNQMPCLRF
jgi:hypothetical protein